MDVFRWDWRWRSGIYEPWLRDLQYKQFITLTTTKTRDQLIIEFNETLKVLRIAQQGDAAISTKVPIFNKKYDETNILKLLRTKIERPELSERECYLLELAQTGRSSQLNDMIDIFSNTETYISGTGESSGRYGAVTEQ